VENKHKFLGLVKRALFPDAYEKEAYRPQVAPKAKPKLRRPEYTPRAKDNSSVVFGGAKTVIDEDEVIETGEEKRRSISMPELEELLDSDGKELASGLSVLVGIYYVSKSGDIDKIKVTIRKIWQKENEVFVEGFCHNNKKPVKLRASRMKKIIDLHTKETYVQPRKFLLGQVAVTPGSEVAGFSPTAQAINRIRNELAILVFLAKIDKDFDVSESNIIIGYVRKRCSDLRYVPEEVKSYIDKLSPDEDNFYDAMEEVLELGDDELKEFVETFVQVILADGVVDDEERIFLAEMLQIMEEEGIDIDIGI